MFRKDLFKDQGLTDLRYYGWYLDCLYDTTIKSKHEFREKFRDVNLEKDTSTNLNLRGVKHSQNAKIIRKLKK